MIARNSINMMAGDQSSSLTYDPGRPFYHAHPEARSLDEFTPSELKVLATVLKFHNHTNFHEIQSWLWDFIHAVKQTLHAQMTGLEMLTHSCCVSINLLRAILIREGVSEEVIQGTWTQFCAHLPASFAPPASMLQGLHEFYSEKVAPDDLQFHASGWVAVKLSVLAMYEMANRSALEIDLNTSIGVPASVDLIYKGKHVTLLIRSWVIMSGGDFYKFPAGVRDHDVIRCGCVI